MLVVFLNEVNCAKGRTSDYHQKNINLVTRNTYFVVEETDGIDNTLMKDKIAKEYYRRNRKDIASILWTG